MLYKLAYNITIYLYYFLYNIQNYNLDYKLHLLLIICVSTDHFFTELFNKYIAHEKQKCLTSFFSYRNYIVSSLPP